MAKEIAVGTQVTVNVTGDAGTVESFDHDGTSGKDFAGVRLEHSGRLAWIPLDDATAREAEA
jgi:hypothetical protein